MPRNKNKENIYNELCWKLNFYYTVCLLSFDRILEGLNIDDKKEKEKQGRKERGRTGRSREEEGRNNGRHSHFISRRKYLTLAPRGMWLYILNELETSCATGYFFQDDCKNVFAGGGAKMVAWVGQWESPTKTCIFENTKVQLSLKDRPEYTGQHPDYIHTHENPAPCEEGKIQAAARQDLRPLTPAPGRRRGVGAGREREPRTAKHPALAICTRTQTCSACVGYRN